MVSKKWGKLLKKEIRKKGLTQKEFADLAGVSERGLRWWIAGSRVDPNKMQELFQLLGKKVKIEVEDADVQRL